MYNLDKVILCASRDLTQMMTGILGIIFTWLSLEEEKMLSAKEFGTKVNRLQGCVLAQVYHLVEVIRCVPVRVVFRSTAQRSAAERVMDSWACRSSDLAATSSTGPGIGPRSGMFVAHLSFLSSQRMQLSTWVIMVPRLKDWLMSDSFLCTCTLAQ